MKKNNCEYCDLPINISEARDKKRMVVENDDLYVLWCSNCGKLNVIRKTGGENGKS